MGNALFIVWRESAEAMLVVGILYAWLKRRPDATVGMRYLWGGVAAGVGVALAFLTFWVLQQGGRILTWRTFFRVSEILLLLLAGALLVSGIEKSIGLGIMPPVVDQLWDSTRVLDDSSRVGGVVAAL